MQAKLPNILVINGSLRGQEGNTGRVVTHLCRYGRTRAQVSELCLAEVHEDVSTLEKALDEADGLIFCGGVYWNGHGSVLQRFIEVATAWETTGKFLGKPAGVVLTMDSVGGMEVAARLLGILNLLGCMVVPLGAVVLSRVSQMAAVQGHGADVYTLADADILFDNMVLCCAAPRPHWRTWPVEATRALQGPYPCVGPLRVDRDPWLES